MTQDKINMIHQIIADISGFQEWEISENDHLINDLGLDSLDLINLQYEIESAFNIVIPDHEWEEIECVGDIYELI